MEINNWAVAFFVIYTLSFALNLWRLGQGNVPHITQRVTKGKRGAVGIMVLAVHVTMFCGALGAYS